MLKGLRSGILAAFVPLVAASPLQATIITYDVSLLTGNTFEYTYFVENDTLGDEILELAIYFDVGWFENLRMPFAPPGWDPLVVQPDVLLPDDGFVDFLALGPGIAPGGGLGSFTVLADYLAPGSPGSQAFDILDPITFAVLETGSTVRASNDVPEPRPWALIALGLGAFGLARLTARRRTV